MDFSRFVWSPDEVRAPHDEDSDGTYPIAYHNYAVNFLHDLFVQASSSTVNRTMVMCTETYDLGTLTASLKHAIYRILVLMRYMLHTIASINVPDLPKKLGCLDGLLAMLRRLFYSRPRTAIRLTASDAHNAALDLSMLYGFSEIRRMRMVVECCIRRFYRCIQIDYYNTITPEDDTDRVYIK